MHTPSSLARVIHTPSSSSWLCFTCLQLARESGYWTLLFPDSPVSNREFLGLVNSRELLTTHTPAHLLHQIKNEEGNKNGTQTQKPKNTKANPKKGGSKVHSRLQKILTTFQLVISFFEITRILFLYL
ncbi:hypothetical protein NMG60_11033676 [Bertholletia excelsa]